MSRRTPCSRRRFDFATIRHVHIVVVIHVTRNLYAMFSAMLRNKTDPYLIQYRILPASIKKKKRYNIKSIWLVHILLKKYVYFALYTRIIEFCRMFFFEQIHV